MHALKVIWHSPHIFLISTHSYELDENFFPVLSMHKFQSAITVLQGGGWWNSPVVFSSKEKIQSRDLRVKAQDFFFFFFSKEKITPETREAGCPWRARGRVAVHWVLHFVFMGGVLFGFLPAICHLYTIFCIYKNTKLFFSILVEVCIRHFPMRV